MSNPLAVRQPARNFRIKENRCDHEKYGYTCLPGVCVDISVKSTPIPAANYINPNHTMMEENCESKIAAQAVNAADPVRRQWDHDPAKIMSGVSEKQGT